MFTRETKLRKAMFNHQCHPNLTKLYILEQDTPEYNNGNEILFNRQIITFRKQIKSKESGHDLNAI